jgi:hypothetical protein
MVAVSRSGAHRRLGLALASVAAACGVAPYQPYYVELPAGLPADAFARCRSVLADRFGGFTVVDPEGFRLQTRWAPWQAGERPGERRATVFRGAAGELAIVVEVRMLEVPVLGSPRWTDLRGDPSQERELGAVLQEVLR